MKRKITPPVLLAWLLWSAVAVAMTGGEQKATPPKTSVEPPVFAVVETSMGSFQIELFGADAPKTVENFVRLAEKKYFDGTHVHRISRTEGVIQMGDEKSKDTAKAREWGTDGHSIWGKPFQDELNPNTQTYRLGYQKGVVAMANRGPNTNASQFFIMLRDMPYKPKNYTIFGRVVEGQTVVDAIGKLDVIPQLSQEDGRPGTWVRIKKITVARPGKPAEKVR